MKHLVQFIKTSLSQGKFRLSIHAAERLEERFVTLADIKHCGKTAKTIVFQEDKETWKVIGKDLGGKKFTVICDLDEEIVVVTVF